MGILDIEQDESGIYPLKRIGGTDGVTPDGKYALASIYETKESGGV